ncbi:Protein involved in biosynthesis of mitomycin antibiotics/polyketide fumonisin [hydrothermal vent metagenome]|uniref:Protein involved in biosynthesis of mitomycin antibiotics/polyketide fumonisin n=1 Tax=hydrothermal vent metagenome TaxID=652676 RepID=A0A1W1CX25_9ZZZZ
MKLTKQELQDFKDNGFIVLRQFVETKECKAILNKAKEALHNAIEPLETESGYSSRDKDYRSAVTDYQSHSKDIQNIRRLRQVYERDSLFKAWMENTKIRPILKQVLEDEVVLITAHHNSIMNKMPQSSQATSWHQDIRYWHYSDNNLVSVWLALGKETSQNGALEFIPQSHKETFNKECFDEKDYFKKEYLPNKKLISKKISLKLDKGDVVLFHASLLHRANKNTSNTAKISFVYTVKGLATKSIIGKRSANFPERQLHLSE